jgi:serine/threonine protein kinase/tetratricopeptide (TPR) repeat protein
MANVGAGDPLADLRADLARWDDLTPAELADRLQADQARRWRSGRGVPAEAYLDVDGRVRGDLELIVDLILGEILLRRERGESPDPAEYARRFPDLADELAGHLEFDRLIGAEEETESPSGPSGSGPTTAGGSAVTVDRATSDPAGDETAVPTHRAATDGDATADVTDPPVAAPAPSIRPLAEGPGTRIGPYKLLQEIGQGGMGAVFLVEQDQPVRRRVALKVIKAGMDSAQVVARFEAERQALALMDHPNIARVFDAGTTDGGRPFFVMELVKGIPITQYCDEARLSPKQRLELFIPVCQAIQHAHQKGIIHRDVKPSNVLVTLVDGKPVPKVIDFGIAKATDQRLTERSLFTQLGSIVGTLEYMSPEQADLASVDVDTRTDVYALGVLLYELLTGTTPLERERLREAGYAEILRRIKEEEPSRPSTRLSGSGDRLASIAAVRGVEPGRLARTMRGDLDWIVMKALEKSRTRRYETANGFARDVQRYLDGDAVEACPPSAGYRLRKFVGKHRAAIATAAALAGLLIAGAGISVAMAVRAVRAERATGLERDRAVAAEGEAKAEGEKSRRSAEESRAVLNFFQEQVLAAARPEGQEGGLGPEVSIRKALDAAEPRIAGAFRDQPAIEASVRDVIGRSYIYLGEWGMAIGQLERARQLFESRLGPDHPDTFPCRTDLAAAYRYAGRTAEAIPLLRATVEAMETRLGRDHPDTLNVRNDLGATYVVAGRAAEAIALIEPTLKLLETKLGPDHIRSITGRANLAEAYLNAGRDDDAIRLHEANLKVSEAKLGPNHPDTLNGRNNLARAYQAAGRTSEAIPLLESSVKACEARLGTSHPTVLTGRFNLAQVYVAAGRIAEAIRLQEANLKASEAKLGADHLITLACRNDLAKEYLAAGRTAEAIRLHEANLKASEATLGPDHLHTLIGRNNLGRAYRAAGRTAEAIRLQEANLKASEATLAPDHPILIGNRNNLAQDYLVAERTAEAIPLFEASVKAFEAKLGTDHPSTLTARNNLAAAYQAAGRTAQAISLFEVTLRARETKLGPDHPDTLTTRNNLAAAYQAAGRTAEAIPLFEATLRVREAKLGPDHPGTLTTRTDLAGAYQAAGRTAEAESLFRDALERARKRFGPADPRTVTAMAQLGQNLIQQGQWLAAEPVLRECLAVREKAQSDDWSTFNTRSLLGGSLLGQKKYAEAEPFIVAGYEGLKAREAKIPPPGRPHLPEAAERAVKLYEAWGKMEKAAEWRTRLVRPSEEPQHRPEAAEPGGRGEMEPLPSAAVPSATEQRCR